MERRNPPFARIRNRSLNGKVHDVCRVSSGDVFRIAQEFLRSGYSDQSCRVFRGWDVGRVHIISYYVLLAAHAFFSFFLREKQIIGRRHFKTLHSALSEMQSCRVRYSHTTTTGTSTTNQQTVSKRNRTHLFTESGLRRRRVEARGTVDSFVGGGGSGETKMFALRRRFIRTVVVDRRSAQRAGTSLTSSSSTTTNRELSNESASTSFSKNHKDVTAPFHPSGDQPTAIAKTLRLLKERDRKFVSLRGATGTGKTFVVANVIAEHNKPVLVVVPNKTLAAQVARELRGYLRTSHLVELFVSHFSVYIPESCSGGRYVEKRSAVDPDLDALRHRATRALVEAKSTNRTPVIVASVSCLYGLGLPSDFVDAALFLGKDGEVGQYGNAENIIDKLETECLYERAPAFGMVERGQFRTRNKGTDQVEIRVWPPYTNEHVDITLDKDSGEFLEGKRIIFNEKEQQHETEYFNAMTIWPRVHYVTPKERVTMAIKSINEELVCREHELREEDAVLEADRLRQRVSADLEMLRDIGWCPGAEHYSRHLRGAKPGEPPVTLLDYFSHENNQDWLLVADESHVMLPQLRAMSGGDKSRKEALVKYGYRLPSALDNRPLTGDEFWQRVPKCLLVSATPGDDEHEWCGGEEGSVDMVVRPSGILDPPTEVLPKKNQLPKLASMIEKRARKGEASLVCALTKADCEDLAAYLTGKGLRADWMHSELAAPERAKRLAKLQLGELDVVVGAQLLREGLDLPRVSLVAILDADVSGFARSSRSLMQMMGRAARNKSGEAVLFADKETDAMKSALKEVERRRRKQALHNEEYNVTPKSATQGSESSERSLFDIMSEEIDAEKMSIGTMLSKSSSGSGDTNSRGGTVNDEEVERALERWRQRREPNSEAFIRATTKSKALERKLKEDALAEKQKRENQAYMENDGTTLGDLMDASGKSSASSPSNAEAILTKHYGFDEATIARVKRIREMQKTLPAKCGVYRFLDKNGKALYVGKAKSLRSRTSSYLTPGVLENSARHRALLYKAESIDCVLTPGGEADALALEARIIQRERPRMNILLKDVPRSEAAYIVLSPDGKMFVVNSSSKETADPRTFDNKWIFTQTTYREARNLSRSVDAALDLRGARFRVRYGDQDAVETLNNRVAAACLIFENKIQEAIEHVENTCTNDPRIVDRLKTLTNTWIQNLENSRNNGSLAAFLSLSEEERKNWNVDVCAAVKSGKFISVKIVRVRDGNVLDVLATTVETYDDNDVDEAMSLDLAEACQRAIESTYADVSARMVALPESVYIPHKFQDAKEAGVAFKSLGIGKRMVKTKKNETYLNALSSLALENAREEVESIKSENDVLTTLSYALNMDSPSGKDTRLNHSEISIEGLDCSHFAGEYAVAAFARFDGSNEASGKHKVYTLPANLVNPSDDYEGIRVAISKRCQSRTPLPDVILVDGGAGQLRAAKDALEAEGVAITNVVCRSDLEDSSLCETGKALEKLVFSRRVALASLAKGRSSGTERVFLVAEEADEQLEGEEIDQVSNTDTAFTLGIGVETVVDGPAMHLLRKVRDASHSVAIGSQRRRRRESRLKEFVVAEEEIEEDDEVVSV